jgi:Asp/Glu/hydantoin racemase
MKQERGTMNESLALLTSSFIAHRFSIISSGERFQGMIRACARDARLSVRLRLLMMEHDGKTSSV